MKEGIGMKAMRIFAMVMLALVLAGLAGYAYLSSLRPEGLQFTKVDLSSIPDGEYDGEAKITPVKVSLTVKVEAGRIISIDIKEHVNGKGKKAEEITGKVIESQSLDVDTISGATWSSYTILKAIEDAIAPRVD